VLVVDVDAVEPVRVDDPFDGSDGVAHSRVDGTWGEYGLDDVLHAVAADPGHHGDVRVSSLDGGHRGGGERVRVPERGEHAVGRRGRGLLVHGGVVDGEGEDEVEAEVGVDGHVRELDARGLRADVLTEQVPVRHRGLRDRLKQSSNGVHLSMDRGGDRDCVHL
jgi:hypothetical protein